jgi:HK97 family phage major capsid protein
VDKNELLQERGRLVEQMRAMLKKAGDEKRELTAEENQQYGKLEKDQDGIKAKVDREAALEAAEKELNTPSVAPLRPGIGGGTEGGVIGPRSTPEYRAAFTQYLKSGYVSPEIRGALQADNATGGGYLIAPEQFAAGLIKAVDDLVEIRKLATKISVPTAASLGAVSLDTGLNDFDWTPEIKAVAEDTSIAFGKRELHPHQLSKLVKVANKLLRSAVIPVDNLVRDRLAYVFAVTEEKGFLNGSGSQQPLGLFTADANGISTGRDVATGSTTNFTTDGLIDVQGTLKPQYQAAARWLFHRDAITKIRKLKDGVGAYIWQAALQGGIPDTILGKQYILSEYVPKTFTTGLYVGLYGDFSFYWIADSLSLQVQVVNELYALTNQIGFIGRAELDGMPVLEEAFVRIKTT